MFWDILTPVGVYLKISANGAPSCANYEFLFSPISSFEVAAAGLVIRS
jgi:hypothetical protein